MSEHDPMYHYQFRVILVGDSTVGKSSLLKYFTEGRVAEFIDPTVGVDFYARMIEIKPNYRVKLQLWDTAGQEKFRSITRSYYRNSVGVMVVYDISKRSTFENVTQWLEEAEGNLGGPNPSQCVFLLIGHKADLDSERQVMYEEGEYFAKYRKIKFVETSAVSGENVQEAFKMIANEINDRLMSGALRVMDGWEGIRCGLIPSNVISLNDEQQRNSRSSFCPCSLF